MPDDKPPEAAPQPDLAARVAQLEAELTKERQQGEMYQRTLSALSGAAPQPQQPSAPPPNAGASTLDRLVAKGWTREQIEDVLEIMGMGATPIVQRVDQVLGGFHDKLDLHDLLVEEPGDAKKYRGEIEQERKARQQQGQPAASRRELLAIVKSRHLPELIAEETARKGEEEKARAASAASAATEGSSQAPARPTPTNQPAKPLTRDQIDAIPDRADRIKAIEDAAEGQTF